MSLILLGVCQLQLAWREKACHTRNQPNSCKLSVVKAGYRFSGAAAPCSGVQGMYKLPAAAFAQCILLPTLQNVGVKLLATF